ncbi:MAG: hypothetical protein CMK59_02370 [Proteobacteria bacterium]|nr:hypothetical protein [Pseudomonadota bacterium]
MTLNTIKAFHPELRDDDKTLILKLDHGRANEMGSAELSTWMELCDILETGTIRTLITTSIKTSRRGKPLFISGANVTERQNWSNEDVCTHVRWQRSVLQRLRKAPVFHIALANGIALGWGTEFMLTADYRIATSLASFGLPETSLGILPGAGGCSELWMEIGIAHAMRLGMTGEKIDAKEAVRIGLVQEDVEDWDLGMNRALELAKLSALRSPTAVCAFKKALLDCRGASSEERSELEAKAYEHCVHTGEAAIGRANFKEILSGSKVEWGTYTKLI